MKFTWVKGFKNGPSEICWGQSLKYLNWNDMVCLSRPYHFKVFIDCLPQILPGPFLNTLNQLYQTNWKTQICSISVTYFTIVTAWKRWNKVTEIMQIWIFLFGRITISCSWWYSFLGRTKMFLLIGSLSSMHRSYVAFCNFNSQSPCSLSYGSTFWKGPVWN